MPFSRPVFFLICQLGRKGHLLSTAAPGDELSLTLNERHQHPDPKAFVP
jgi:hypothetical protein